MGAGGEDPKEKRSKGAFLTERAWAIGGKLIKTEPPKKN